MGVRAFGDKKSVLSNSERIADSEPKPVSIFDTGAISTGNEHPISDTDGGDVDTSSFLDPATLAGDSGSTGTGKRRGRKPGSRNRATGTPGKSASQTSHSISNILFSMHMMASVFFKTPELSMEEEEAKELATAITRVTELYDVPMMDEKTMAWINLAMVGAKIYGPRAVAVTVNKKNKPRQNMGVVDMPSQRAV